MEVKLSMIKRVLITISYITIIASFALLLRFLYLQYAPIDVITDAKITILTNLDDIKRNSLIKYELSLCKTIEAEGKIKKYFKNGIYFMVAQYESAMPSGCMTVKQDLLIPPELPNGTYKIQYISVYEITPFRHIEEVYESEEFTIK